MFSDLKPQRLISRKTQVNHSISFFHFPSIPLPLYLTISFHTFLLSPFSIFYSSSSSFSNSFSSYSFSFPLSFNLSHFLFLSPFFPSFSYSFFFIPILLLALPLSLSISLCHSLSLGLNISCFFLSFLQQSLFFYFY